MNCNLVNKIASVNPKKFYNNNLKGEDISYEDMKSFFAENAKEVSTKTDLTICDKYSSLKTISTTFAANNTPYTLYIYDPKTNTREYGEQLSFTTKTGLLPNTFYSENKDVKEPDQIAQKNVAKELNKGNFIVLNDGRYLCRTVDFDDLFRSGNLV